MENKIVITGVIIVVSVVTISVLTGYFYGYYMGYKIGSKDMENRVGAIIDWHGCDSVCHPAQTSEVCEYESS